MKKALLACFIMICLFCFSATAQEGGMPDRAKMKQEQKEKLIKEVKLTDAQADSVLSIQQEFRPKMRGMRGLPPEEREAKIKEINDAMKIRLQAVLKDEKLVNKVLEFQDKERKEMMEKMRQMRPQE